MSHPPLTVRHDPDPGVPQMGSFVSPTASE